MDSRLRLPRQAAHHARHGFFDGIVSSIDLSPTAVDKALGMAPYHVRSSPDVINDPAQGTLLIPFRANFHGGEQVFQYLIRQIGHEVHISLILKGESELAPLLDSSLSIDILWPGSTPKVCSFGDALHYEWLFAEPNLLSEYLAQERFVLGIRQFHFRVAAMLHSGLAPSGDRSEPGAVLGPRRIAAAA